MNENSRNRPSIKGPFLGLIAFCLCLFIQTFPKLKSEVLTAPEDLQEGIKLRQEGKYAAAIEFFNEKLSSAQLSGKVGSEIICLIQLGDLYWNEGKLQNSEMYYIQANKTAAEHGFEEIISKTAKILDIFKYYREGKEFRAAYEYKKSEQSFAKAISLSDEIKSPDHKLKCLRQLSITYWNSFDFVKFRLFNEEALKLARKLNHTREVGMCLNNLGLYHWKKNDYSKALVYCYEALEIAIKLKNPSLESDFFNNIGVIYLELGVWNKAYRSLRSSLEISSKLGEEYNIASNLLNLGRISHLIEKNKEDSNKLYKESLEYLRNGLNIIKKYNDNNIILKALNNIGFVYLDLDKFKEANKYFYSAYNMAEKIGDYHSMGMILSNIGYSFFKLDNFRESEELFLKAISIGKEQADGEVLWEAYYGLGRLYEKMGKTNQAVRAYGKSIEEIEKIRGMITLDVYKASFSSDKARVYEAMVNLLFEEYSRQPSWENKERLFKAVERAKARAFLESLGVSQVLWQELLPEDMREKEKALSLNIFSITQNLSRPNLSQEEKEKLRRELTRQEEAYLVFLNQVRCFNPELSQIIFPHQVSLKWAQENLIGNDTALVEYFVGEKKSVLICITREDCYFFELPGGEKIRDSLRGYLKLLSSPVTENFLGELASKRLYRELLGRAEAVFPVNIKRLIIVPDDVLFFLPFGTLSAPLSSENDEFLVERYFLSYSPSVSSLALLNSRENEYYPVHFLAFGNPSYSSMKNSILARRVSAAEILMDVYLSQGFRLSSLPGSEREVKKISRLFPESKRKVFLRDKAREEILKKRDIRRAQVLHFACHGFFDLNVPFRSALVLSQVSGGQEDGFFQVREIYSYPIEAEMVVLSACQTGKGTLKRGEGLVGLPRVFFISGARSVISTLWNIEDRPAADFMIKFYKNLSRGMNKVEALCETKKEMIKSNRHSHPHYWGAFVLNGDALSTIKF